MVVVVVVVLDGSAGRAAVVMGMHGGMTALLVVGK